MTKQAHKKKVTTRSAVKAAVNAPVKGAAVKTDENKRLARNAALRAWRKANREKVSAYMTEWRKKRAEKAAKTTPRKATTTKTTKVDAPRVTRAEMRALNGEEARALLRGAEGDRLAALLILALLTGMRSGELLGLTWRAVDFDRGSVGVIASLQPDATGALVLMEPKTARSRRVIDIEPRVVAALRRHRAAQEMECRVAGDSWDAPISDLVFATPTGAPIDGRGLIRTWFRPLLKRVGLPPIRIHDLRHTYASVALAKGVHPKVVQEALGHSTIAVTLDLYSHVVPSLQREAATEMGVELFG